jgi:hypothetical protein
MLQQTLIGPLTDHLAVRSTHRTNPYYHRWPVEVASRHSSIEAAQDFKTTERGDVMIQQ